MSRSYLLRKKYSRPEDMADGVQVVGTAQFQAAAQTEDVLLYVANVAGTVKSVKAYSFVPIAAASNTFDLLRQRGATTGDAIVTQFDPDTLVAKTMTTKTIAGNASLAVDDKLILRVVKADTSAAADVSVVVQIEAAE